MHSVASITLVIAAFLVVISAVQPVAARLHVPFTVLLACVGVLVGGVSSFVVDHARLGPVLVPLVLLSLILEDKSGYRERVYHEAPITEAWRALREQGSPPAISSVATSIVSGVRRDDALIGGASAFPCYEPTFGYGLVARAIERELMSPASLHAFYRSWPITTSTPPDDAVLPVI